MTGPTTPPQDIPRSGYERYQRSAGLAKLFALAGPIVLVRLFWGRWRRGVRFDGTLSWLMASLGVWCFLAGVATWTGLVLTERVQGNKLGRRVFELLTSRDPETTEDAAAAAKLFPSSRYARRVPGFWP